MNATKGSVHPVTAEELAKHLEDAEFRMANIVYRGSKINLFDLVRKLDPEESYIHTPEEAATLRAIREGICLYFEIFDILERATGLKQMLDMPEKRDENLFRNLLYFVTTYAMFALGSYVSRKCEALLVNVERNTLPSLKLKDDFFVFTRGRTDSLVSLLADYVHMLHSTDSSGGKLIRKSWDYVGVTDSFFGGLAAQAAARKKDFMPEHLEKVENTTFKIGNITIHGFESTAELTERTLSFIEIRPEEVIGNREAKRELLRNIDRLALYDAVKGMNPVLELGGLSWSILFDGLPGTGKTSLFRLAMSRLKMRAEQVGLPFEFITVDQSIKDEFYGRTGKNLLERLERTRNTNRLILVFIDDIDLLFMSRSDPSIGGADKDILNITMQFLDGIYTKQIGNCQVYAATNEPTATDSALRQRFHNRYLIDGPTTWEDFGELLNVKLEKFRKANLLAVPDGGFVRGRAGAVKQEREDRSSGILSTVRTWFGVSGSKGQDVTWEDIGRLCEKFKQENERFTGRSIHAVVENLKARACDFDIPEEFFTDPEKFLRLTYEEKVARLRELYRPITGEMIIMELERYFNSEKRYAADARRAEKERLVHRLELEEEARREFRAMSVAKREDDGREVSG